MNALVEAAIAAELAALERDQDAPTGALGYGSDLSCDRDLTERMDEVDGFSTLALGQAIARRLDCPRGALPDDREYGISLRSYLNRGSTDQDLRTLEDRIRAEATKDDRVDQVEVAVELSTDRTALTVDLKVTPVDPKVGGFSLTLAVTSGGVVLDAIGGQP